MEACEGLLKHAGISQCEKFCDSHTNLHLMTVSEYYENRYANLIIIIRVISSFFFRDLLKQLPIRCMMHKSRVSGT